MMPSLPEIKRSLTPVFDRYGVKKVILFGSVARGEYSRHSDIDLIIVVETPLRFIDRYNGILGDLNDSIPERAVEPLIYTPSEFQTARNRPFIRRALAEGVVIYESR